jgi:hypothetical protein
MRSPKLQAAGALSLAFVLVARGAAEVRRPRRLVAVGGPEALEGADPEPDEPPTLGPEPVEPPTLDPEPDEPPTLDPEPVGPTMPDTTVNMPAPPVRENDVSAVPSPSFDAAELPEHRPPLDVALAALENIERGEAELRDLRRDRPRRRAKPAPEEAWSWAEPWSFEVAATPGNGRNGRVGAPARERPNRTRRARPRVRRARRAPLGLTPGLFGRTKRLLRLGALALLAALAGAAFGATHRQPAPRRTQAVSWARSPRPSPYAIQTIPAAYLHIYWRVGEEYGLDWTKLAAVGRIESDHGRLPAPGVVSGTNRAGAAGPAQFTASTWARFGVDASGHGVINPYDPLDAITAMAAYLKASGAPQHWRRALYAYNHSMTYVGSVMSLSHRLLGARITPR